MHSIVHTAHCTILFHAFYLCEQNLLDCQSSIDLFAYVDDDVVGGGWDFVADGSSTRTIAPKYHQCLPCRCFSFKFRVQLKAPPMRYRRNCNYENEAKKREIYLDLSNNRFYFFKLLLCKRSSQTMVLDWIIANM